MSSAQSTAELASVLRLALLRAARRLRSQRVNTITLSQLSALATVGKCGPMSAGELAGKLISLTGTWAQRVAQDWLVLQLTNSGTVLGIVTALQFAPALLLSLYGGALADRGDKRRLLLATQTGIALTALALGLLDVGG